MKLIAHGSAIVGLQTEYESECVDKGEAIEKLAKEFESMSVEAIEQQLAQTISVDEIEKVELEEVAE